MADATHEVHNQYDELTGYDLYRTDVALQQALDRAGGRWAVPGLAEYGARIGTAESFALADAANRYPPALHAFDRRGRRLDQVSFHPAWHDLMRSLRGTGCIGLPFEDRRDGRWAASLATMYLHSQVESGTLCPTTMTWAAIPLIQREAGLWPSLGPRLVSRDYDPRDLPAEAKGAIYVGMGMTEKQGGSDVRANTTLAVPMDAGGRGGAYRIRGHKWFFSAPMCDGHLVVAQAGDAGPSCFYVPRWRPDGSRNPIHIQRLKDKVGNRSNSSSEVEFHDAWGVMVGEAGRGIPTIIEMAAHTRLNCVMSSAAFLRQAVVQGIAYTRRRKAFGRVLAEQPLMRAVLADLVLESEAALALMMRLAGAFERSDAADEQAWKRWVTPAAKFWICKRAVELTGEAMEIFGGNGYVEDGPMGRLFREAPVNSIWEGSGNVMCLDVIRGFVRDPQGALALLDQALTALTSDAVAHAEGKQLRSLLSSAPAELEGLGRSIAQRLVLVLQAALLRQAAPSAVADGFIATRFGQPHWGRVAGAIDPRALDIDALLARALPA